jgi:glycosyltransferase involved in cell wall biosynthesis/GT2 family glycosyltransferase
MKDEVPVDEPAMTARERELRAEIDRLRLEKQQLIASSEHAYPLDRILGPARHLWRAVWQRYYIVRWHLLHARAPRRGLKAREAYAPYVLRPRSIATEPRRKVLHVVGNFHTGGSAQLIVDLIEHLGQRFEHVVLVRSLPAEAAYTGVELIHRPWLWSAGQVTRLLRRVKPDLVHVHMLGHQNDDYGRRDWRWYHKVMVALESSRIPVIENLNIPVEPYVSPSVLVYVHVSNYVRDRFGRLDAWNQTIYPGSDLAFFSRPDDRAVPDDVIGMVYRLQPDKLNEAAIEPFIKAVQRRPATRALIVGGGQYLDAYRRRVAEAGLTDAFTFTGYVSYKDLPNHLAAMSVFVAPVHTESFGQVSPFAMGMSIPVAGYNVGALEEITAAPDLLAHPGDAEQLADIIVELLDDRPRRLAIGAANRKRAEVLFSVETMVGHYEALYEETLKAPWGRTMPPRAQIQMATSEEDRPTVSVVMAVFNGERHLREAIDSVLGQTLGDFELIIVDDGSTDGTRAIIESYDDPRVRRLDNDWNIGLSRSLNRGVAAARGRYIARLDADDVSEPTRLEQQVYFLRSHPDVSIVGCRYSIIDDAGQIVGHRPVPCDDIDIRWMLDFCNPFAHSAVMMRRQALEREPGPYDESLVYAMDYDLWTRLAAHGRLANLSNNLIRWRTTPGSLTSRFGDHTERLDRVARDVAQRLRWPVHDTIGNERKGNLLCAIVSGATPEVGVDEAQAAIDMLFELHEDFCRRHKLDAQASELRRYTLVHDTARALLWMGHLYPDRCNYTHALRALAAAVRRRPEALVTPEGMSLAAKLLGGRLSVSIARRLGSAQ